MSFEAVLKRSGIPDDVYFEILECVRPTSLPEFMKNELELMATFQTFKNLSLECDKGWEEYYKAWNRRRKPGYIYPDEDDPTPSHMWSMIEYDLIKGDKDAADHYMKNLTIIKENPEMMEKLSNYERVIWNYKHDTGRYERARTIYRARETLKDLVSYIECLQAIIDRVEQAERHREFRAQFETEEDYEDYLIDQENEEFLEQISTPEGYMEWRYG